ncbi:MAG: hypothetical protein MHM6MM_003254 [Cercozoa sp. M6MM]
MKFLVGALLVVSQAVQAAQWPQKMLSPVVAAQFDALPHPDQFTAEYVWLDADGDVRSKLRVFSARSPLDSERRIHRVLMEGLDTVRALHSQHKGDGRDDSVPRVPPSDPEMSWRDRVVEAMPEWNYDGSSTQQADGGDSEVELLPVKVYRDPFRAGAGGGANVIVLCDIRGADSHSKRTKWADVMNSHEARAAHPWFGLEQEYTLLETATSCPLGWPSDGEPPAQGPYYCGNGAGRAVGRLVSESHARASMYAGLLISGTNGEVAPGQWEYQIGPVEGMDAADQLVMSRFLLRRVAESYDVQVSFAAKPIAKGCWNGAGLHTNYSTQQMRTEAKSGDRTSMMQAIERLGGKHKEHMAVYGVDNAMRLCGEFETSDPETFSSGQADRGASVRLPRNVKAGYFEDRRPAASASPYDVVGIITQTTLGLAEK